MPTADFRHPALGPVVDTYGPNIKVSSLLLIIGGAFCSVAFFTAQDLQNGTAWIVFAALTAAFGVPLLWVLSSRVRLHEAGISHCGLLGEGELRWPDVASIYFSAYEIHAHYIPLGTFCRLRLVSVLGQRLSFGERI